MISRRIYPDGLPSGAYSGQPRGPSAAITAYQVRAGKPRPRSQSSSLWQLKSQEVMA